MIYQISLTVLHFCSLQWHSRIKRNFYRKYVT